MVQMACCGLAEHMCQGASAWLPTGLAHWTWHVDLSERLPLQHLSAYGSSPRWSAQPGSCGAQVCAVICRPPGGVLANYWKCLPRENGHSRHVKTIVNTRHAIKMLECVPWPKQAILHGADPMPVPYDLRLALIRLPCVHVAYCRRQTCRSCSGCESASVRVA